MKNKVLILCMLILLSITTVCWADIDVVANNLDGSVRYYAYQPVKTWNSIDEFATVKVVDKKEIPKYFMRLKHYGPHSSMFDDVAYMILDKDKYQLTRYTFPVSLNWKPDLVYVEVLYAIPDELISKIQAAKSVSYSVTKLNNKTVHSCLYSDKRFPELKRMLTLKFSDFNNNKVVNP